MSCEAEKITPCIEYFKLIKWIKKTVKVVVSKFGLMTDETKVNSEF